MRMIWPEKSELAHLAVGLDRDATAEMALPSYLHPNPLVRWVAWYRLQLSYKRIRTLVRCIVDDTHSATKEKPVTAVDFGCGSGIMFMAMLDAGIERLYACDNVLDVARKLVARYELEDRVSLHTPADMPWKDLCGKVDVFYAGEVFEHVPDLLGLIERVKLCLGHNGRLLVTAPTENVFYRIGRSVAGFTGDYHVRKAQDIDRDILDGGLSLLHSRRIPSLGFASLYWINTYQWI